MFGKKVIVAHPAQQHSFKTALAVDGTGFLQKYITTVYVKKYSFTSIVQRFIKGDNLKKLNSHRCDKLDDYKIMQFCELESILLLILARVDRKRIFYNPLNEYVVKKFNKKVVRYAIKNQVDAIILYDTLAFTAFEELREKAPHIKLILDMSAPNFTYMYDIFKKDTINEDKCYSNDLISELSSVSSTKKIRDSKMELELADFFLVASSFTKKSLEFSGVSSEKIIYCPYGIDAPPNSSIDIKRVANKKLNCIYIGNVNQKKGVLYLLKAIENLDKSKFHFTFIGDYNPKSEFVNKYKEICDFVGHVHKDKVLEYCRQADVIVFPSLADGFGFSVLEALLCGVPAICSTNAGVSDLIIDGYNGFKIRPADSLDIIMKLNWLSKNRDKIIKMRINSRITAEKYTWDRYNSSINIALHRAFISKHDLNLKS